MLDDSGNYLYQLLSSSTNLETALKNHCCCQISIMSRLFATDCAQASCIPIMGLSAHICQSWCLPLSVISSLLPSIFRSIGSFPIRLSLHQIVAKVSFNCVEYFQSIFQGYRFRIGWLHLSAAQGTLKSFL